MRFKAKLSTEQVSLLHSIITPISKLQDSHGNNRAVLYLDPDFLRLSTKNNHHGITCFAELLASKGDGIFLDHRIESAADNVIVMEVDLASFKLALSSVLTSSNHNYGNAYYGKTSTAAATSAVRSLLVGQHIVILKLAKRSGLPCLCLDGHASNDGTVEIHQAIPVRIMRASEMQQYIPPQIHLPTVQLEFTPDKPLRSIVDKLRNMGQYRKCMITYIYIYIIYMVGSTGSTHIAFRHLTYPLLPTLTFGFISSYGSIISL